MVRRKHIHALVDQLLKEHGVSSAPTPVVEIAKALGADVRFQSGDDDLSGFLYRDRKHKSAIIGVNADHHSNRQNFTAAHELGHFLLHDFDDVHVDRRFKVWLRNDESSQGTNEEEKEANLFAAEFLMPARFLQKDIEEIGEFDLLDDNIIEKLAEQYGVSTQAMTFRLTYLGYVKQ